MARSLTRKRFSNSLFVVYFGLKRQYPEIAHHTVLFGPRYRELLDDIFDRGVLPDDFSLYLHDPSRTDPSLAPPGQAGFYALAPVPNLGKAPIDWSVHGPEVPRPDPGCAGEALRPRAAGQPRHVAHLHSCRLRHELNAHLGSAFSLEPLLTQSAFFRVHNRDDRIHNLYFVGAGTHPGAGIPGVIGSAKATAGLMLADPSSAGRGEPG